MAVLPATARREARADTTEAAPGGLDGTAVDFTPARGTTGNEAPALARAERRWQVSGDVITCRNCGTQRPGGVSPYCEACDGHNKTKTQVLAERGTIEQRFAAEQMLEVGSRIVALMQRGFTVHIEYREKTALGAGGAYHVLIHSGSGVFASLRAALEHRGTDHHAEALTLGEAVEVAWAKWGQS